MRAAIGFGAAGEPRRWIRQLLASWLAGRAPSSDWLGDWAMAGVDETPAPALAGIGRNARAVDLADLLAAAPDGTGQSIDLPIYAGVAVRDEAAADLFLRNARASLGPAALEWRPRGVYRGMAVTRVERAARGRATSVVSAALLRGLPQHDPRRAGRGDPAPPHRRLSRWPPAAPRGEAEAEARRGGESCRRRRRFERRRAAGRGHRLAVGWSPVVDRGRPRRKTGRARLRRKPGRGDLSRRARARRRRCARAGGGVSRRRAGDARRRRLRVVRRRRRRSNPGHGPRRRVCPQQHPRPGAWTRACAAWLDALTHARLELSLDNEPATAGGAPLQSAHVHLTARR